MGWWKVLGFSRGVIGAVGLLGAAELVLPDYGASGVMAGAHAAIVAWNVLAGHVGDFVGPILGLPELPPEIVNALVIGTAIGPAWAFSILKSEWGAHQGFVQNAAFWTRIIIAFLETYFFALMMVSSTPLTSFFWLAVLGVALPMLGALRRLPTYRYGFMFTLGFLGLLEGAYLMSTETVKAAVAGFVCEHSTSGARMCDPDPAPAPGT